MVVETKTQSIFRFANVLYMTKIAFNHINDIMCIAVDVLSDRKYLFGSCTGEFICRLNASTDLTSGIVPG